MNNKFIDPSIKRKYNIINNKLSKINNFPLFSIIEFNIYGSCNRECSFCPVSNPDIYEKKHEALSIDLFNKILDDLVDISYKGKILFSAFSEPLLHKDIEKLISSAKNKLPECRIEIVSNGDLLSLKRLKSIFKVGLDTISVSMYDGEHQIKHFTDMAKECELDDTQLILRRRYFKDGNYGITISNRTGLVDSNVFRDENENNISSLPLQSKCYYPFYMILVDYDGSVLLCPHDWSRKLKFGNVKNMNIWDIWKGNMLNKLRDKLSKSDRNFTPCDNCDVIGTIIGEENYNCWINTR